MTPEMVFLYRNRDSPHAHSGRALKFMWQQLSPRERLPYLEDSVPHFMKAHMVTCSFMSRGLHMHALDLPEPNERSVYTGRKAHLASGEWREKRVRMRSGVASIPLPDPYLG